MNQRSFIAKQNNHSVLAPAEILDAHMAAPNGGDGRGAGQ
jgi:hypothetical protein